MSVNAPRPISPAGDTRLYLREEELDRAVDLFFTAARVFWRSAEAPLSGQDLGPAHYRALAAVRRNASVTPTRLAALLGVRKQSLARVLNELERAGLIARAVSTADRRERRLSLTEAGKTAEAAATAALRERLADVFRAVGAERVAGARAVLEELANPSGIEAP